jgi:hypothetical protein
MRNAAHLCPVSYCGNLLQWRRAACCKPCFKRLSFDLRNRLTDSARRQAWHEYSAATIEALAWLNAHPLAASPINRSKGEHLDG